VSATAAGDDASAGDDATLRATGSPVLRAAQETDAPALAALEELVFPHPWTAAQLASELRLPTAVALAVVAPSNGRAPSGVIAFALFRRLFDEAELLRLAVLPEWRQRGLARELVEHGLARLRQLGVASAFLEVRADNATAIRFYERGGWTLTGHRARYYPDGAHARLYRRAL
jgi:ribosomal-protein-alanine N-acetyltransferase